MESLSFVLKHTFPLDWESTNNKVCLLEAIQHIDLCVDYWHSLQQLMPINIIEF